MESDIVERLRGAATSDYGCRCVKCEAADEIQRLRAELAAMREQRDEARRMYCVEAARHSVCRRSMMDKQTIAEMNGWDCFAQQEGGGA